MSRQPKAAVSLCGLLILGSVAPGCGLISESQMETALAESQASSEDLDASQAPVPAAAPPSGVATTVPILQPVAVPPPDVPPESLANPLPSDPPSSEPATTSPISQPDLPIPEPAITRPSDAPLQPSATPRPNDPAMTLPIPQPLSVPITEPAPPWCDNVMASLNDGDAAWKAQTVNSRKALLARSVDRLKQASVASPQAVADSINELLQATSGMEEAFAGVDTLDGLSVVAAGFLANSAPLVERVIARTQENCDAARAGSITVDRDIG